MPLHFKDYPTHVNQLISAALKEADPAAAVGRYLRRDETNLTVGSSIYDLSANRLYLIAVGKAALSMGVSAANIAGDLIQEGVLITKHGFGRGEPETNIIQNQLPDVVTAFGAGHPISDESSIRATAASIKMLENTRVGDLVLCLISGGASALFTQPMVSLEDWQSLSQSLLASGCSINDLNAVRKQLDRVKGGGLIKIASPASCASLILSDVVGNPLDIIGSGPTVINPDPPSVAREVINRYQIENALPQAVWNRIDKQLSKIENQPHKPTGAVNNIIVGDVSTAAEAAKKIATKLGFSVNLLTSHLEGEAREVGRVIAALAKDAPANSCLILGGETTVTLLGDGIGSRNMEIALSAAIALEGYQQVAVASFATDGDDGPTNAAGAIITGETAAIARQKNLDPNQYLDQNDSFSFFKQAGGLLKTGPTGTNVNDLIFILHYAPEGIS